MTSRRPLPEQVQALAVTQAQQARQLRVVEADARRSAQQAEGAIEDVRDLSDVVRILSKKIDDTKAAVLVVSGHQQEQLVVLNRMAEALEELRPSVESARRKASAATHKAVAVEARQSKTDLDLAAMKTRLDEAAAQSRAIVAAPPVGEELKELQREVLKGAKPLAGKLGLAFMALLIAACVYGAAAFTSCSGGF